MVEQRPVVTGLRQAGFVEIREGVRPGEQLVADGLNKVQPGQPVRVAGPQGADPKSGGPQGGRRQGAGRPPA